MNTRKKNLSAAFLMVLTFMALFPPAALSSIERESVATTIDTAGDRIYDIKETLLKNGFKTPGTAIVGWGHDDSNPSDIGPAPTDIWAQQNVIGAAALLKNFQATADAESSSWATEDLWPRVRDMVDRTGTRGVRAHEDFPTTRKRAIDQFMFLEFVSESYSLSDSGAMYSAITAMLGHLDPFKANDTEGLYGKGDGDWWTMIEANLKYVDPQDEINTQHPLVKNSLWAAAGLSTFAQAVKGTQDDITFDYSSEALELAENSIAFADAYCYDRLTGLYWEDAYRQNQTEHAFQMEIQATALLALARLAQATQKEMYVTKADALIQSIIRYFYDSGRGGVYTSFNAATGEVENVKRGWDNALMAYAAIQLAIARGLEEFNIGSFIRGKDQITYFNIAVDLMNYMNNYHWRRSEDAGIRGYIEWVDRDGEYASPPLEADTNRRADTNMLALYNLAEIIYATRPWYVVYQMYLIVGGGLIGVIVLVSVLLYRRSQRGTKLGKTLRGILADEDD